MKILYKVFNVFHLIEITLSNQRTVIGKTKYNFLALLFVTFMLPNAVTSQCNYMGALAESELNLIKTRQITNEVRCNDGSGNPSERVFYMECLLDYSPYGSGSNNQKYWRIISGGTFKEYCDGSAHMNMRVQNLRDANYKLDISIIFKGRTNSPPSGSPFFDGCVNNAPDWYYYTSMRGTLVGVDGLAGGVVTFTRKGPAFQIGTGASQYGYNYGASGWLDYTIISHPNAFNFRNDPDVSPCGGDLNFYLSGGNLGSTDCPSICPSTPTTLTAYPGGGAPGYTYSWSNGLGNTKNVNVNPLSTTTYIVTITDSRNCSATDAVTINVNPQLTL
ncbi:MAG TPA: hypothetical protein PKD51_13860, partial [Saprospiraceae bacterium]|nr:hypothetical protein [Saprospiraceae bacterium]